MPLYAQCTIHDRGVTYAPGDEVPADVSGADELVVGGALAESAPPVGPDPTQPDISDLLPTSPPASEADESARVVDSDTVPTDGDSFTAQDVTA